MYFTITISALIIVALISTVLWKENQYVPLKTSSKDLVEKYKKEIETNLPYRILGGGLFTYHEIALLEKDKVTIYHRFKQNDGIKYLDIKKIRFVPYAVKGLQHAEFHIITHDEKVYELDLTDTEHRHWEQILRIIILNVQHEIIIEDLTRMHNIIKGLHDRLKKQGC